MLLRALPSQLAADGKPRFVTRDPEQLEPKATFQRKGKEQAKAEAMNPTRMAAPQFAQVFHKGMDRAV